MWLTHEDKPCELWNCAIQGHFKMETCSQPNCEPVKAQKRGVVVAQPLRYVNCNFTTPLFKLYEEVHKPGRSAAVQNMDLNAAITSTCTGFMKLQLLLAALDLSLLSENRMHEMSQAVWDKIAICHGYLRIECMK